MSETCVLRLVERLPTGIYADQYELQGIQRRGGFMEAQIHGDVNLEQPALLSAQSILNVHVALLEVENDGKNGSTSSLQARVTLLLHARYLVIQSYYPSFWQRIDITLHSILWKRDVSSPFLPLFRKQLAHIPIRKGKPNSLRGL